jgi:hypothetical protein
MFSSDRDLLPLEPNLFTDVALQSQRLLDATGSITGTTLTLTGGGGVDAAAVGVTTGHVVLVAGVPLEVLSRTSPTQLEVSRVRGAPGDPAIPPAPVTGAAVSIATFLPQIAIVHAQLLRMAGLDSGAQRPGAPGESSITNASALRLVESLGALNFIWSAAAALAGPDSAAAQRARLYAQRFSSERSRVMVALDLDNDGQPDAARRLNAAQTVRA